MNEFDDKDLEAAGMHIEDGEADDLETGLHKKAKSGEIDEEEEDDLGVAGLGIGDDDEEGLM